MAPSREWSGWPHPWFSLKSAYFYQGSCCLLTGDLQKAAGGFSQVLRLPGESVAAPAETARTLHSLATEFARRKQHKEAVEWNQKAVDLTADDATKQQYRSAQRAWTEGKTAN